MSKLEERENRRKQSFVEAVISKGVKEGEESEKLIQRSYYLTNDLLKAITIKTAEGELDKSGVVREALKMYLSDIIEKM